MIYFQTYTQYLLMNSFKRMRCKTKSFRLSNRFFLLQFIQIHFFLVSIPHTTSNRDQMKIVVNEIFPCQHGLIESNQNVQTERKNDATSKLNSGVLFF